MTLHIVEKSMARKFRGTFWMAGILLLLFLVRAVVTAEDRLKTFQNAINYLQDDRGCLSIPYGDYQDACQRKQNEVTKMCKESGPFNCVDIDPKYIQQRLEKEKTNRDQLKAEKENQQRKRSAATNDRDKRDAEDKIKEIDNKLYDSQKAQEVLEREINDRTKAINDRLYIGKACRDARAAVISVFNDARSRASGESDPAIKPLAQTLIQGWEARMKTHEEAVTNAKTSVENCEKVLYEIGHLGRF